MAVATTYSPIALEMMAAQLDAADDTDNPLLHHDIYGASLENATEENIAETVANAVTTLSQHSSPGTDEQNIQKWVQDLVNPSSKHDAEQAANSLRSLLNKGSSCRILVRALSSESFGEDAFEVVLAHAKNFSPDMVLSSVANPQRIESTDSTDSPTKLIDWHKLPHSDELDQKLAFLKFFEDFLQLDQSTDEVDAKAAYSKLSEFDVTTSLSSDQKAWLKEEFEHNKYQHLRSFNYKCWQTLFHTLLGTMHEDTYRVSIKQDCQLTQLRDAINDKNIANVTTCLNHIMHVPKRAMERQEIPRPEAQFNEHQDVASRNKTTGFFNEMSRKYNAVLKQLQTEASNLLQAIELTKNADV